MGLREVLTFQLGSYSNYIGAHWWNIQESTFQYNAKKRSEINHDVLFREGKTMRGHVTFTPRTILIDKNENMVNIPTIIEHRSRSPDSRSPDSSMDSTSLLDRNSQEKHNFIKDLEKMDRGRKIDFSNKDYKFEETVRTWSDFLRIRYLPKSIRTFPSSYQTDIFHSGAEIYSSIEDDLIERIRSYMEECNNLQGFQVLADATDGFGGLANGILFHLQDEYSRKPIFTLPSIASSFPDSNPLNDVIRTINILLSYQKLTENSSLVVPLGTNTTAWRSLGPPTSFPYLIYSPTNHYQTSAILASFLDTVTLKYRMRDEHACMHDLVSGLNYYNKKVCAATMSLPFPMASDSYLLDTLEGLDDSFPLWSQLTPGCNVTDDAIFYQKITVRGIPVERLKAPENQNQNRSSSRAYSCTNVQELVHLYLSFRLTAISDVTSAKLPLKTVVPYPRIFSPHVSPTGAVDVMSTRMVKFEVNSCPAITGLHCCKAVGRMLDSLHQSIKTVNVKKFHQFFGTHMDIDEFNECLEKVLAMGYGYASDIELR